MKIAICDDCREDILQLEKLIRNSRFCPEGQKFFEYLSGEDLLNNYMDFDIIILDMCMRKGMNGIETARHIRKRDAKVIIMFYSDYESKASKISSVRPYNYILKKSSKEEMLQNLDMVLEEIQLKVEPSKIPIVCNGQVFMLQISDIVYIQIYKKGSQIWLTNKKREEIHKQTIESSTKLKDYYELLGRYGFIYASASYIINAEKVISCQKTSVILQGNYNLPVARRMKKVFDEELGKYYGVSYRRERKKKNECSTDSISCNDVS